MYKFPGNERPNDQSLLTAIYRKERINMQQENVVKIWSLNLEGSSLKYSELRIPSLKDRLPEPQRIKKSLTDGEYHLSWSPPHRRNEVTSYTVFWCVSKSELPNHCESSMDFTHVNATTLHYRYRSNATINFAVAANSAKSTSGMIWALCTAAQSNDIGKIKTIWIPKLSSTEIELEWKLECVDTLIVEGYTVKFCPTSDPKTLECKTPEIMVKFNRKLNVLQNT